jgi:hypothetical protein
MGNLIQNERMKLHATFFNNLAVGLFFSVVIATALGPSLSRTLGVGIPGIILAMTSYHLAYRALGKLKE